MEQLSPQHLRTPRSKGSFDNTPLADEAPALDPQVELNLALGERNLADLVQAQGPAGSGAAMARVNLMMAYVDAGRIDDASRLLAEVGWTLSYKGMNLPPPGYSAIAEDAIGSEEAGSGPAEELEPPDGVWAEIDGDLQFLPFLKVKGHVIDRAAIEQAMEDLELRPPPRPHTPGSTIKITKVAQQPKIVHPFDVKEDAETDLFDQVIADADKPKLAAPPEILTLGRALRLLLNQAPPDKQAFAGAVTRTLERTNFCIRVLPEGLTARSMVVNSTGALQLASADGQSVDLTNPASSVPPKPREFELMPHTSAAAGPTVKRTEDAENASHGSEAASSLLASILTPAEPQPPEIASLAQRLVELPNNPPPDKKKFAQEVGEILERNGYCIKVYPEGRIARRMYTNHSGSLGFQCTDGTNTGLARRTDGGHLEVRRIELIPYRRRYSRQPIQTISYSPK